MTLSLDANVLIEVLSAGDPSVRKHFEAARLSSEVICVSTLVVHELAYGAHLSRRSALRMDGVMALIGSLAVVDFCLEDALEAARVCAGLKDHGRRIGSFDVLIASQALVRGWTVVTANVREFARIDGLNVIDWTIA